MRKKFMGEELFEELRRMLTGWQDNILATNPLFFPNETKQIRRCEAAKKENWKRKKQAYNQLIEIVGLFYNFTPTTGNINALPESIRSFIYDIETNVDPAGMVRENVLLKDENEALRLKIQQKPTVTREWLRNEIKAFWGITEFDDVERGRGALLYRLVAIFEKAGVEVMK